MAVAMTSGDVFIAHIMPVTTTANLAGKSLITVGGAAASNASAGVFGVIAKDTKSGDVADVKVAHSIVEVIATGTVTAGAMVEVLQGTVYANIDGTSTSTTSAGVTDLASGYPVGKALSSSDVYGTVLVALILNQVKSA
jgi:hypothetical protein